VVLAVVGELIGLEVVLSGFEHPTMDPAKSSTLRCKHVFDPIFPFSSAP
jgi:hypothetical protein